MPKNNLNQSRVKMQDFLLVKERPNTFAGKISAALGIVTMSIVAGSLIAAAVIVPTTVVADTSLTQAQKVLSSVPEEITIGALMEKTNVYAKDGAGNNVLLASFFDQNREEVSWDAVSQYAKDAAVAGEDIRFYEHDGVDYQGLARAAVNNFTGKDLQGGSSITQQYVKNVLIQQAEALSDPEARKVAYKKATETSLSRKAAEVKISIQLEKDYTKDQILLGYMNIIGFGGQIYGIQAAAKYYFGVTAQELTLSQSATLIGIINNPNSFRIDQPDNPENGAANGYALALDRRNYILDSMLSHGKITKEQHDAAFAEPITPNLTQPSTGCATAAGAAYFCDYVTSIVKNDPVFGDTEQARLDTLRRGGLQIYTTLNMDIQAAAESATNTYVPRTMDGVDIGSASVTVEPGTGRVLAMAQNKDYTNDPEVAQTGANYTGINYNTDYTHGGSTGFQVGSTYKLFTLVEWLKTGHSLYQSFNGNVRTYNNFTNSCQGDWNGSYRSNNDGGAGGGWMNALRATSGSVNSAYMAMASQMDLCAIAGTAETMGVHRADGAALNQEPFSVLGSNEIAGLDMAVAYATIASQGVKCSPVAIDRMTDSNGNELPIPSAACSQVLDPGVASAAAVALQSVVSGGTATASYIGDGIPLIGKTGTTDDAVHTWMIGGSTRAVTATWVGNVTGFTSMRGIYINGNLASDVRHLVWRSIMATANQSLGGGGF